MKIFFIVIVFAYSTLGVCDENIIIGKWKDKTSPTNYKYEFKKGNDFVYEEYGGSWGQSIINRSQEGSAEGVWEVGFWRLENKKGVKSSCNLFIYAGTKECCFKFKRVEKNLILTKMYDSSGQSGMCKNRVLIKDK